jgi:hypothetical protein
MAMLLRKKEPVSILIMQPVINGGGYQMQAFITLRIQGGK